MYDFQKYCSLVEGRTERTTDLLDFQLFNFF